MLIMIVVDHGEAAGAHSASQSCLPLIPGSCSKLLGEDHSYSSILGLYRN